MSQHRLRYGVGQLASGVVGRGQHRARWGLFAVVAVAAIVASTPTALGIGTGRQLHNEISSVVESAPRFTSPLHVSVKTGKAFTFIVVAAGVPLPTVFALQSSLPPGLTFHAGDNGKGTLKGVAARAGRTTFVVEAANAAGVAKHVFTIVTTPSAAKELTNYRTVEGRQMNLVLRNPTVAGSTGNGSITCSGLLPTGVHIRFAASGLSLTLIGSPRHTGRFPLSCSARNLSTGLTRKWPLLLQVSGSGTPPTCIAQGLDIDSGEAFSLDVAVLGTPTPRLGESGSWPTGVTFSDNGNGTGIVSGALNTPGSYRLHIMASNTGGSCRERLSLVVRPTAPVLNSPGSGTVRAGTRLRFPIVATGTPTPIITLGPGRLRPYVS